MLTSLANAPSCCNSSQTELWGFHIVPVKTYNVERITKTKGPASKSMGGLFHICPTNVKNDFPSTLREKLFMDFPCFLIFLIFFCKSLIDVWLLCLKIPNTGHILYSSCGQSTPTVVWSCHCLCQHWGALPDTLNRMLGNTLTAVGL